MNPFTENGTDSEHDSETSYPPPPHFDADMIAAAQPVEPLTMDQTTTARPTSRRFLKGRWGLLAVLMIGALLSAVLGGILLGVHDAKSETAGPADPSTAKEPLKETPPVEAPKASTNAPPVKVSDNIPARSKRLSSPWSVERTKPDQGPPSASEKPVARKVGVLYFGPGKEDRKGQKGRRRHGENDDNN
ncbi:MAG: hypothetical protein QOF72_774 [Blastocatellia bacterium]|jgi:hypothetical protein|nr:hypothetical protein [Blastocatellia bacterium]